MKTDYQKPSLLVWGINYAPEETGIAPYTTDACRYFDQRGCIVSVLTAFPYYPQWRVRDEDRWKLFRSDLDGDVQVLRCGLFVPARPTAILRMMHEASFTVTSFLRGLFRKRPDAILAISPPLLLGAAARLLAALKRTRYFVHVQDMQPDAAIQMGFMRPGLFTRLLYFLESLGYGGAIQVSGITQGMVELLKRKGVPDNRTFLLPNWQIPGQAGAHESPEVHFRIKYQIDPNEFLVAYSGNLGRKQGLNVLIEAAKLLKEKAPNVRILIAGDGGEKEDLARRINEDCLPNVTLLPLLVRSEYEALLREADLFIVTQQAGSGALFFPSKLLNILSAAKPVVTVSDPESELSRAVAEGNFGVTVLPSESEKLAATLKSLSEDTEKLSALGRRGPAWIARFRRDVVLNELYARLFPYSQTRTQCELQECYTPNPIPEKTPRTQIDEPSK